jgi:ATP-dependent DNA ligase
MPERHSHDVILDGEAVALGTKDRPSINRLQRRMHVVRVLCATAEPFWQRRRSVAIRVAVVRLAR